MKLIRTLCLVIVVSLVTTGCHWLNYRIEVDQGNVIDKQTLSRLQPGMSKEQVKQVLGTPLLTDMFHGNRWDYVQYYRGGRKQKVQQGKVSLFFTNGVLSHIKADELAEIKSEKLPYSILSQ
ncbi:MAG: cell envelope protein SmpA [Gammaproteobacteria bacterium]|nr:MAG: cell envelope protein SmpA [Gammaproteobacteria bacterium]